MRITDVLSEDDIRALSSGKNTHDRSLIYKALDRLIEIESEKILKSPGISDDDFLKDIRCQIGKVKSLQLFKRFLVDVDKQYGR